MRNHFLKVIDGNPRQQIAAKQKLYVVVPAFNEQGSIASVIAEIRALQLPNVDVELVVVDDGSSDLTKSKAKDASATVVSMPYNMGIGMSVQTGFCYALDHGAEFIVQIDGDGQHISAEVAKLFAPILAGTADVVIGTRFLENTQRGLKSTTILRWLAGRGLAFSVFLFTGKNLTDTTSGFRLFNRKAAEFVAHSYPDDYPEVQVLVMLARQGFQITEVPVHMRERAHGVSSINWWRSVYYMVKVVFASFMDWLRK